MDNTESKSKKKALCEKKRRERINEKINEIHAILPCHSYTTREQILNAAIERIIELQTLKISLLNKYFENDDTQF